MKKKTALKLKMRRRRRIMPMQIRITLPTERARNRKRLREQFFRKKLRKNSSNLLTTLYARAYNIK